MDKERKDDARVTESLFSLLIERGVGGLGNFALNRPLLITLLQIPPPTLPCALLDQHRVPQIKSFQVCTGGPVFT
jgi:hypothetical protein